MLRRKMLQSLAIIPFVGTVLNKAKPAQLVVARAACECEGYVKISAPLDERGWFAIPQKTCIKCHGMVDYHIIEEDNPNLKNQIQRSKK